MSPQLTQVPFVDRLVAAVRQKQSHIVVGLDPRIENIPRQIIAGNAERFGDPFEVVSAAFSEFNRRIIDAVSQHAVAVKPRDCLL